MNLEDDSKGSKHVTPNNFYTFCNKLLCSDRYFIIYVKKGKAVPLQAWSGPEGFRKLRFPDFLTTAQDGVRVVSPTHRPPLPPERLLVLISLGG
jgi:hypothetical protein